MVGFSSWAQQIEGTVRDKISGEALEGASVTIQGGGGSVSDANGKFVISDLDPGSYTLTVSHLSYDAQQLHKVWVKANKVAYIEVRLDPKIEVLDRVVVRANPIISDVQSLEITEEKINRIAASYNDPARLVVLSPDVLVTNDQNNQISVRGLSPSLNSWRIEGVEVVNPNHLSNAGTFNDQPAATGGGVNILSAQVLDNSRFLIGNMNSTYTNGVAGVFDMNLRNGYAGDHQFTAQASFIGFDFSAEGPLSSAHKSSYLVNYRYSFTGLLGLMGVDFNGETIAFQDLSAHVNMPFDNGGYLKFYASGGLSSNDFNAKTYAESEVEKDRSDILYEGNMGVIGAKLEVPVTETMQLQWSAAYSGSDQSRDQTIHDDLDMVLANNSFEMKSTILANRLGLKWYRGASVLEPGVVVNYYDYELKSPPITYLDPLEPALLINPYLNWDWQLTPTIRMTTGASVYHMSQGLSEDQHADYRMSWVYDNEGMEVSLSGGKYSQLQQPKSSYINYTSIGQDSLLLNSQGILSSYRGLAKVAKSIKSHVVSVEGFYYSFPEVTERWMNSSEEIYENNYAATTLGASLSASKSSETFDYEVGVTLFNSTYNEGVSTPYNIRHSVSGALGKSWNFEGNSKRRTLSINIKGIYQGGLHQLPNTQDYKSQLASYQRLDLRILWVKYKEKSTRSWSLDIQNLMGRENEAFQYYDSFTQQIEMNYQLGMIPILTYRIEF